jgi:hypothetical protein
MSDGDSNLNVDAYLGVIDVILVFCVLWILIYYPARNTPWHTYLTVFICYYASFGILLIVPIDLASTVLSRRSEKADAYTSYRDNIEDLLPQYTTYYVVVTILANFVLVFQENFNVDGYIGFLDRVKSTCWTMALKYGAFLVIGVIVLAILLGTNVIENSSSAVLLAVVLMSNTLNLFLLVFLLGYALIAFPRSLWDSANLDGELSRAQARAAAQFANLNDLTVEQSQTVADVRKTKQFLDTRGSQDEALKDFAGYILDRCPQEFRSTTIGRVGGPFFDSDKGQVMTRHILAKLNRLVISQKALYRQAQTVLEGTKISFYQLEDIVRARDRVANAPVGMAGPPPEHSIEWSLYKTKSSTWTFWWLTKAKPMCFRALALLSAILSLFSLLGVFSTIAGVSPRISVYATAIHADSTRVQGIAFLVLITLGYVVCVAAWSLFQVRFAGVCLIVPFRTTPESLSFNARMVARLAPPLAFFYLGWLFENGVRPGSWIYSDEYPSVVNGVTTLVTSKMPVAFIQFYQVDTVPIIGKGFNTTFPILLFAVTALVAINFHNHLMVFLGLSDYQFGTEIISEEQLREGKRQLERHKKMMERTANRYTLKNLLSREQHEGDPSSGTVEPNIFYRCFQALCSRRPEEENRPLNSSADSSIHSAPKISAPEFFAGWAELKDTKKWTDVWKSVHLHVETPGVLITAASTEDNTTPLYQTDLRSVASFSIFEPKKKKGQGQTRLDIVSVDKDTPPLQLKFKTENEAQHWQILLQEWKDYFLDTQGPLGTGRLDDDTGSSQDIEAAVFSAEKDAQGLGISTRADPPVPTTTTDVRSRRQSKLSTLLDSSTGRQGGLSGANEARTFSPASSSVATAGAGAGATVSGFAPLPSSGSPERRPAESVRSARKKAADDSHNAQSSTRPASAAAAMSSSSDTDAANAATPSVTAVGTSLLVDTDTSRTSQSEPAQLSGYLEKKSDASKKGGYKKMWVQVDAFSGQLLYKKDGKASTQPLETIDLRLLGEVEIEADSKGRLDTSAKFRFDTGSDDAVFKTSNAKEAQRWVEGLNQWREYFLLNMVA